MVMGTNAFVERVNPSRTGRHGRATSEGAAHSKSRVLFRRSAAITWGNVSLGREPLRGPAPDGAWPRTVTPRGSP